MILYDAMNDDDDEVRDEAARIVSHLVFRLENALYLRRYKLSVPAARAIFIDFLIPNVTTLRRRRKEVCLRLVH